VRAIAEHARRRRFFVAQDCWRPAIGPASSPYPTACGLRARAARGQVQRAVAQPIGLDLTLGHVVVLAAPGSRLADAETAAASLERAMVDRFGDRDELVPTKDTRLVVLVPGPATARGTRVNGVDVAEFVYKALRRSRQGGPWLARTAVNARDLLVYRVVARDQAAVIDLIQVVLGPLTQTLDAYFATGEVATEAARRLHLSVRTVTYRLAMIAALSGHDPGDPTQRFALHVAVLGACLLQWPEHDLPISG
jgi:hypothetical protein